jgi:hypothetical protein
MLRVFSLLEQTNLQHRPRLLLLTIIVIASNPKVVRKDNQTQYQQPRNLLHQPALQQRHNSSPPTSLPRLYFTIHCRLLCKEMACHGRRLSDRLRTTSAPVQRLPHRREKRNTTIPQDLRIIAKARMPVSYSSVYITTMILCAMSAEFRSPQTFLSCLHSHVTDNQAITSTTQPPSRLIIQRRVTAPALMLDAVRVLDPYATSRMAMLLTMPRILRIPTCNLSQTAWVLRSIQSFTIEHQQSTTNDDNRLFGRVCEEHMHRAHHHLRMVSPACRWFYHSHQVVSALRPITCFPSSLLPIVCTEIVAQCPCLFLQRMPFRSPQQVERSEAYHPPNQLQRRAQPGPTEPYLRTTEKPSSHL